MTLLVFEHFAKVLQLTIGMLANTDTVTEMLMCIVLIKYKVYSILLYLYLLFYYFVFYYTKLYVYE